MYGGVFCHLWVEYSAICSGIPSYTQCSLMVSFGIPLLWSFSKLPAADDNHTISTGTETWTTCISSTIFNLFKNLSQMFIRCLAVSLGTKRFPVYGSHIVINPPTPPNPFYCNWINECRSGVNDKAFFGIIQQMEMLDNVNVWQLQASTGMLHSPIQLENEHQLSCSFWQQDPWVWLFLPNWCIYIGLHKLFVG